MTVRYFAIVVAAALLSGCMAPDEATTATTTKGPTAPPRAERISPLPSPGDDKVLAIVDVSDQRLTVVRGFEGGETEQHHWVISSGIERKPTPLGAYYPDFLSPTHVSSIYNVPMPWSVFFNGNIAIHGDPDTRMLGLRASNGCVRVHPEQAEIFYRMVEDVGRRNTTIIVRE